MSPAGLARFAALVAVVAGSACTHDGARTGDASASAPAHTPEPAPPAEARGPQALPDDDEAAAPASGAAKEGPDPPVVDEFERARISVAEVEAKMLHNATAQFVVQRGKCPVDAAELAREGMIPELRADPWGGDYRLECKNAGDVIVVHSDGADRTSATTDDVSSAAK